ncbi:hypothetical protein Aperf_G00000032199 [Anoplocephala perfoliata]
MGEQPPLPPTLTMEDIATFRRCRKESFWRGSVPMIIGANLLVGLAHSRGFFLSRPRLLYPSYFLAGIVGYVGGKISYIGTCKSMFLQLNDSRVKDFLLGQSDKFPLPPRSNVPWSDSQPVEGPVTYAQRREYFRQQQLSGRPGLAPPPNMSHADYQETPQLGQEQTQPSQSSPSSSEYFDTQPLKTLTLALAVDLVRLVLVELQTSDLPDVVGPGVRSHRSEWLTGQNLERLRGSDAAIQHREETRLRLGMVAE